MSEDNFQKVKFDEITLDTSDINLQDAEIFLFEVPKDVHL